MGSAQITLEKREQINRAAYSINRPMVFIDNMRVIENLWTQRALIAFNIERGLYKDHETAIAMFDNISEQIKTYLAL